MKLLYALSPGRIRRFMLPLVGAVTAGALLAGGGGSGVPISVKRRSPPVRQADPMPAPTPPPPAP